MGKFWWTIQVKAIGKEYMPNTFSVYMYISVRKILANCSQFAIFFPYQNIPVFDSEIGWNMTNGLLLFCTLLYTIHADYWVVRMIKYPVGSNV